MTAPAQVFVGCDHAGFALKAILLPLLIKEFSQVQFVDEGCHSEASVDYPAIAALVANRVTSQAARGLLICGSGIGMSIAANKVAGIRAAMVWDATSARLSRQHNDSNIICLGARVMGAEVAWESVSVWLNTAFLAGRHERRIDLIRKLEQGS